MNASFDVLSTRPFDSKASNHNGSEDDATRRRIESKVRFHNFPRLLNFAVPRKVLKDVYDSASEVDEPEQLELDQDPDEIYDDDQFYRESEAIPPAPKLQGDHNRPRGTFPPTSSYTIPASSVPTTVESPFQRRDETLEGKPPSAQSYPPPAFVLLK